MNLFPELLPGRSGFFYFRKNRTFNFRTIFSVLVLLIFFFCSISATGQSTVKISGKVTDSITGIPVINANVVVAGTAVGAVTDRNGFYRISNIPLGTYTIKVSHIRYKSREKQNVNIQPDNISRLNFTLEPAVFETEEITVSAARSSLRTNPLTQNSTIITGKNIRESGAGSVSELLEEIPGIQMLDSGGESGSKRVSLRGGAPNQVLILLDGQRIDSGQDDSVDLSNLPLSIVENIEIVKGNLSALYGANALKGVINITTKSAEVGKPYSVRFNTGSFGELIFGTDVSLNTGLFDHLFSAEAGNYDGDFEYSDPRGDTRTRANTYRKYRNLFGKIRRTSSLYSISLQGYSYDSKLGLPGIIYQETPLASSEFRKSIIAFSGKFSPGSGHYSELNLSYNNSKTENLNPVNFGYNTESRNVSYQSEIHYRFSWKDNFSLISGGSFRKDELRHADRANSYYSIGRKKQEVKSLFASGDIVIPVRFLFDRISLTTAIRYDDFNRMTPVVSPYSGISLSRDGDVKVIIRTNYGKSYRPPNFDDLYYEGYRIQGNPELNPERSRGGDTGIALTFPVFGDIKTEYTYFHNIVYDIILWQKRFDGVFSPYNIAKSKLFGSEFSFDWTLPDNLAQFRINHTYSRALNSSGQQNAQNKQLPHRPVHSTFIRLAANYSDISAGIRKRIVSKRYIREANTKPMPAYNVVDMFFSYKTGLSKFKMTANLSFDNIFNKEFMVLERSPIPGRTIKFSVTSRF